MSRLIPVKFKDVSVDKPATEVDNCIIASRCFFQTRVLAAVRNSKYYVTGCVCQTCLTKRCN